MKFMQFTKKKAVAVGLAFGLAAGAGGIAAAYFTAGGSGTGSAKVGSPQTFSVTQTGTPTTLLPGGHTTYTFKVTNPATFSQHFSGAAAVIQGSPPAGCHFTLGAPSPTSATVPGGGSTTVTVTLFMATTGTQNTCAAYVATVKLTV
jgi:hypothetical protein